MILFHKHSSGFTLVEVLVTVVISSVLFITIGIMTLYTGKIWYNAELISDMDNDYMYFQKTVLYQMRQATTKPMYLSKSPNVVVSNNAYFTGNSGFFDGDLLFYTDDKQNDPPKGRIILHRFRHASEKVTYYKYFADTRDRGKSTEKIQFNTNSPDEQEDVLKAVSSFVPTPLGGSSLEVEVTYNKTNPATQEVTTKTDKIRVKSRYKEQN